MPRPTELLDLYAVTTHPPRVEWVDGFGGMEAVVQYLKANPDDRGYCITDVAGTIRAVAFFDGESLLFLTGATTDL